MSYKFKLKHCPCCGSEEVDLRDTLVEQYSMCYTFKMVICKKCGIRTPAFKKVEDAVRCWNRRTSGDTSQS